MMKLLSKIFLCASFFLAANTAQATTFYLKNNNPNHNWNDPCNWYTNPNNIPDSDCSGYPDADDHVVINGHSFIQLQNATVIASLHMDYGYGWIYGNHNFTVLGNARVESMEIKVNGKVHILGNLHLTSGSLGGGDTTFVHGTTYFNSASVVSQTLLLLGGGEWQSYHIGLEHGGKLVLLAGRVLTMSHATAGGSMFHSSGGYFNNYGTFQKNTLKNLSLGATMICDGGNFNFNHGLTTISNNLTLTNALVNVADQTVVDFNNGARTWTASTLASIGTVKIKGANNFAVGSSASFDTLFLYGSGGATFHIEPEIEHLVMGGGAHYFYENFEIDQSFWWISGHLYGGANITVHPLAHLAEDGGSASFTSCKFDFLSGAEWTSGSYEMNAGSKFNFPNGQDFLINLPSTGYISVNSNAPFGEINLTSGSILTKNGAGTAWLDVVCNSDEAEILLNAGGLNLWRGTHDQSFFWINENLALQCTNLGNSFFRSEITGGGTFKINGGWTKIDSSTMLDCHLEVANGSLTVNCDIAPSSLKFVADEIKGTGKISVAGNFNWTGQGQLLGTGDIEIQGFTTISGSGQRTFQKEVILAGGGSWAGSVDFNFSSLGILRVPVGAVLSLNSSGVLDNLGTQSATCGFVIEGSLQKISTHEFDMNGADLTNLGNIEAVGSIRTQNSSFVHPNTGNLSAGIGGIGVLLWTGSFQNSPSGNLIFDFEKIGNVASADSMHFSSNLTLGGTLTVAGADPCWQSFSKNIISWVGTRTGSFANVVLPDGYSLVIDDVAKKIRIEHQFSGGDAPEITCPAAQILEVEQGNCSVQFSPDAATASDDCSTPTVSNNAPATLPIGSNTIVFTAADAAGNTATCSQVVNVICTFSETCNGSDDDCDGSIDEGCNTCPTLQITFSTIEPTCFGNSNGTIFSSIAGGAAPYTCIWSNGKTTQNINLLAAGTYLTTATDANGCTGTASIVLNQPTAINFSLASVADGGNFDVLVSPSGGTPNYTFWRTGMASFQASNMLQDLPAGTYIFKVKDSKGCQKSRLKQVPVVGSKPSVGNDNILKISELAVKNRASESRLAVAKNLLQIFPNPASDILNLKFLEIKNQSGEVAVLDLFGKKLKSQMLEISEDGQAVLLVSDLPSGSYFLAFFMAGERRQCLPFQKI